METLLELQHILLAQFQQQTFYPRERFQQINFDNRITGILGTRGVGKTSFLLHTVLQYNQQAMRALYVSADHIYFLENNLVDLAAGLIKETDIRLLCIDEVHKYSNWQQELKNIVDFHPELRIVFSGSSMIDIIHSKYDLSRRVSLYHLPGLSFREYLAFKQLADFPIISFDELIHHHQQFSQQFTKVAMLKHFKAYVQLGYFPFFEQFSQTGQLWQAIENIVQKTIFEDIASLHLLKTPTLLLIEKLYKYVVHSQPGEFSAYKIAQTLNKDYDNISTYLHYLNEAGLVQSLYKKQVGKAYLRNPIKMYPENSNFIYASYLSQPQDMLLGKVRESFAINQFRHAGFKVYYSDHSDIDVNDTIFEIGGKNKTRKQIKQQQNAYILADGILSGNAYKIPLYLLGFLS